MPAFLPLFAAVVFTASPVVSCPRLGAGDRSSPSAEVHRLCEDFAGHDQDLDGQAEIEKLTLLHSAGVSANTVLVLVEGRLRAGTDAALPDLSPALERFTDDLATDGWRADLIEVHLAPSPHHQDGRSVLALRDFLRAVNALQPLAGVVLVGRFPDALLVRTCNWRKQGDVTLRKGQDDEATYKGTRYLRRVPEDVAHRADVVLADLDGRWEDVYVQPSTRLETVVAVFPDGVPEHGGVCVDLERGGVTYEDFFHVADGKLEVAAVLEGAPTAHHVMAFDDCGDHECSAADREHPNVLAVPELRVSRIDARGVALRPVDGLRDADGRPQAAEYASEAEVPQWRDAAWEADPLLERRLLLEYFDRNHAYRTGSAAVAWRPASVACDLGSGYRIVRGAADDWQDDDATRADVKGRPTLAQFAEWMRYPAILRTVRAHSDPWGSVFAKGGLGDLEAQLAGPAWSFTPQGKRLEPSLTAACQEGKLDFFLLRSLWENGALAAEPSFYLHTGCHGISPPGARTRPHDDPRYGLRQGGEALLFFGRGLALVGRAKVFYDEPTGFCEVLGAGRPFGDAWRHYFEVESMAPSWGDAGGDIGRKRSYFWSVLGDWTLRLRRPDTFAR